MGAVFDWLSSNTQVAYPFKAEQFDQSHKLFVDAWVSHNQQQDVKQSVKITYFDPAGDLELRFADDTLLILLSAADAFQTSTFGDYTIYEWTLQTTVGVGYTGELVNAKLVVLTAAIADFTYPLVPTDGLLIDSLVNCAIKRVRKIGIALPGLPCCVGGGFVSTDKVVFEAGTNMQIALAQDVSQLDLGIVQNVEVRPKTAVVFDVIPGAGAGQFIDCDVTVPPPIKLINKVGPNEDNGDFRLTGQGCTWVERVIDEIGPPVNPNMDFSATVLPALLRLHQDCKACCDCDDYKKAYEMLTRLWKQMQDLAAVIEAYRQRYNELVRWLNEQRDIRQEEKEELGIDQLQVVLKGVSRPNFNLAISATVFNNSKVDISLVTLIIVVNSIDFLYVAGSGMLDAPFNRNVQLDPVVSFKPFAFPDPPLPALPPGDTYTISIPQIKSGQYAAYSLNVRANSEKYFPGGLTQEQLERLGSPQIPIYAIVRSGNVEATDILTQTIRSPLEFT